MVLYSIHYGSLLQNVADIVTKCDSFLLQNAAILLQNTTAIKQYDTFITKYDS